MAKSLAIYYFSGTGNAKNVAQWFSEMAIQQSFHVSVQDISQIKSKKNISFQEGEIIGFCSPTHGFNYPPIMVSFIWNFPKSKNNLVFLINTRAGMKLNRFFLPGLSGIALLLAALILRIKGYKIIGMRSIDLPSNWISLHPGLKPKVVESIYIKCKRTTLVFAEKILAGKKVFRALYDLPQDLLIAPIAIGYYFVGRFILAKTFFASNTCNHCNLCVQNCPVKAIKYWLKRPFWTYKCESCMKCMNACPQRAIETGHGFLTATIIFFSLIVGVQFWKYFNLHFSLADNSIQKIILKNTIEPILMLLTIVLLYRIVHILKYFKVFDYIITYTSLTKFKFWRRYKTPKKLPEN